MKLGSPVFAWVTGLLMACILVVAGAYHLLTLWLALYGVWHSRGLVDRLYRPSLLIGAAPIWAGLGVYTLFGVAIGLWHGERLSYYEAYVPIVLAPFVINAVVVAKPPVRLIWLGAASAAILAGLMAGYQSLVLNAGRASGAMNNIIMFGDLSVLMAMLAACGAVTHEDDRASWWLKPYLILGVVMGVIASLLSGTKGGWLSLLTLLVLLFVGRMAGRSLGFRLVALALALLVLTAVATTMPSHLVIDRLTNGFRAGYHWLLVGEVTDGSVSLRFEFWRQGVQMLLMKPWSGWGTAGAIAEFDGRLKQIVGDIGEGVSVESDLLQAGINYGVPAMASYLVLCLGIMLGFVRIGRRSLNDPNWIALATAGTLMPIFMMEFGLSVVTMGRNAFRHTFIVWSVLLLASLINLQRHRSPQP